jgi:hypothetical protein
MLARLIHLSLSALVVLAACSPGSELDIKIHESPQGAVYLKRFSDLSFQAAHPIKINPNTIALVLNGILIRDGDRASDNLAGVPEYRRAFSGSEIGYLAPLISEALRRAASDQQVGFTVEQAGPRQSASAVLYAYGRSLYVTLNPYRSAEKTATTTRELPDADGSANRVVSFIPEAAKRPDSFLDTRSIGNTLVIDYELLAMLPPASVGRAAAQSVPPPTAPQAANGGPEVPAPRDAEIEALRKELQDIKKQLAEQEAERARERQKIIAPQK